MFIDKNNFKSTPKALLVELIKGIFEFMFSSHSQLEFLKVPELMISILFHKISKHHEASIDRE